jgi:hypothetical protein
MLIGAVLIAIAYYTDIVNEDIENYTYVFIFVYFIMEMNDVF